VVSVAFAHRAGILEDRVADIGVETAAGYRRRGYAQAAVAALVGHFTQRGGEARYGCSPSNQASMAIAQSVGFVPYGKSLILSAPRAA
jgi:RimJ/RimL family protein N-acetyltransferase